MKKLPFYLYGIVLVLVLMHSAFYYPQLPDTVASHFGGGGRADNWSGKQSFFIVSAAILVMNIGIFILIPWASERFKLVKVNLPNRDYWLAPERMGDFYRFFRERMCWFGIVNLIFGAIVMHLVFVANIGSEQVFDNYTFLVALAAYFIFVIIWLISFFLKFRNTN